MTKKKAPLITVQAKNFFHLIRIQQWIKNGFIFLPMFFNGQFDSVNSLFNACIAFFTFSLIASSIYCFNDIQDLEYDKKHEHKKKRPLAKGILKVGYAYRILIALAFSSFLFSFLLVGRHLTFVIMCYFVLNILYTLQLKKIAYLDIVVIAISFMLRIVAGGTATNTPLSYWILIMVFLLALFLALAKRRDELLIYLTTNVIVRSNIKKYNLKIVELLLKLLAVFILILYIVYTLSYSVISQFNSQYVWLTSLFVAFGLIRYFYLIKRRFKHANPTKIILKDKIMQIVVFCWLCSFYLLIYL